MTPQEIRQAGETYNRTTLPPNFWITRVETYLSRSEETVAITFYENDYGMRTPPRRQRKYVPRATFEGWPKGAINSVMHSCQRLRTFNRGRRVVLNARSSGLPKETLTKIRETLEAKYGKGYLYSNETAQLEANTMITRAKLGLEPWYQPT